MPLVFSGWIGCAPKRDYTARDRAGVGTSSRAWGSSHQRISLRANGKTSNRGGGDLQRGNLEAAASELQSLGRRYGRSPENHDRPRLFGAPTRERAGRRALLPVGPPGAALVTGPAQGGYVLAALAARNDELAYDRLARLERDYPQHPFVDRYQTTLQVNVAESRLATARELNREGRYGESAAAYLKALEAAPEVGALYLEAAEAELAADLTDRAVRHANQATELESGNADAYRILGEAHYAGGELVGAYEAYRMAAQLRRTDVEIRQRFESIEREYEAEHLPPEYLEIRDAERVTRGELAALFYLELRDAFDGVAEAASVIATDIGTKLGVHLYLPRARCRDSRSVPEPHVSTSGLRAPSRSIRSSGSRPRAFGPGGLW